MKKALLVAALCLVANTAFAGKWYAAGELETAENRQTHADSIGTSAIVGYKDGDWQYSGKLSTSQAEWGNGSISTSYEGRVKRSFNLGGYAKPYIQGRLGEKVSSTKNFPYYAVDTGLVVPVNSWFDVDFSYRYRNAFDADNDYQTNRYGIEGKVKITDSDFVGLRYAQSYGDSETNSWRLQYTHSF